MFYSYKLGGGECHKENKLVPSSGTYLCSMQGYMCRISTLGGKSPPGKRETSYEGYKRWVCMARHETSSGYMAEYTMLGEPVQSSIKLAKLMIMHSQLDMRESRGK